MAKGLKIQLLGNSIILSAIVLGVITTETSQYQITVLSIALIGIIITLVGFFKKDK